MVKQWKLLRLFAVINRHVQTVKQINDLLSYFGKLDAIVKLQLIYSYCSSLYGSELWDLSYSAIDVLCVS